MFSPTEKRGMRLRSWWTAPIAERSASRGEANSTDRPSSRRRPEFGLVDASHDLDEGRLSCTVLAHQRVNLSGADVERDIVERADARETLADVVD